MATTSQPKAVPFFNMATGRRYGLMNRCLHLSRFRLFSSLAPQGAATDQSSGKALRQLPQSAAWVGSKPNRKDLAGRNKLCTALSGNAVTDFLSKKRRPK
jgi:hypothetical protein